MFPMSTKDDTPSPWPSLQISEKSFGCSSSTVVKEPVGDAHKDRSVKPFIARDCSDAIKAPPRSGQIMSEQVDVAVPGNVD